VQWDGLTSGSGSLPSFIQRRTVSLDTAAAAWSSRRQITRSGVSALSSMLFSSLAFFILDDPLTIGGLALLESKGLLAPGRRAQILAL